MAFIRTPQEEEELRRQQEAAGQTGGGSSAAAAGPSTAAPAGRSPGAPGSASTLDVNAYLKANRPQAEQLGANVAKGYVDEQNSLGADVGKAEQDALGQISNGRIEYDQGFVDKALADPSKLVADPAAMERFNKIKAGGYTGPDGIPNYDDLASRVAAAKQKGALADTAGGQKELIRSIAPQTTAGGRELDALLLGQTPEALNQVKDAAGKFGDIETKLQSARTKTNDAVSEAKNSGDMAKERLDAAFKTGSQNFAQGVQNRFTAARDNAITRAQNIQSHVGHPDAAWVNGLSEQDLKDLGVRREDLMGLVDTTGTAGHSADVVRAAADAAKKRGLSDVPGFKFNDYLSADGNPLDFSGYASTANQLELPGVDQFASPEEYANAAALRSLGYDPGVLGGPAPTAPANLDALNFDLTGARGSADSRLKSSDDMLVNHFNSWFANPASYLNNYGPDYFKDLASGKRPTAYAGLGPEMEALQREAIRAAARRGIINL